MIDQSLTDKRIELYNRFCKWIVDQRLRLAAFIAGKHVLMHNGILNRNGRVITIPENRQGLISGYTEISPTIQMSKGAVLFRYNGIHQSVKEDRDITEDQIDLRIMTYGK